MSHIDHEPTDRAADRRVAFVALTLVLSLVLAAFALRRANDSAPASSPAPDGAPVAVERNVSTPATSEGEQPTEARPLGLPSEPASPPDPDSSAGEGDGGGDAGR